MTDLAGALQKAIFTKLNALEFSDFSGFQGVVSEPPTSSSGSTEVVDYPFILLGDDQITDQSTKDTRFERHEVSIHTCFQSSTKLEVRAAQEMVRSALHQEPLPSDEAEFSDPFLLTASLTTLEDGTTQIGTSIFVILAQESD